MGDALTQSSWMLQISVLESSLTSLFDYAANFLIKFNGFATNALLLDAIAAFLVQVIASGFDMSVTSKDWITWNNTCAPHAMLDELYAKKNKVIAECKKIVQEKHLYPIVTKLVQLYKSNSIWLQRILSFAGKLIEHPLTLHEILAFTKEIILVANSKDLAEEVLAPLTVVVAHLAAKKISAECLIQSEPDIVKPLLDLIQVPKAAVKVNATSALDTLLETTIQLQSSLTTEFVVLQRVEQYGIAAYLSEHMLRKENVTTWPLIQNVIHTIHLLCKHHGTELLVRQLVQCGFLTNLTQVILEKDAKEKILTHEFMHPVLQIVNTILKFTILIKDLDAKAFSKLVQMVLVCTITVMNKVQKPELLRMLKQELLQFVRILCNDYENRKQQYESYLQTEKIANPILSMLPQDTSFKKVKALLQKPKAT